MSLLETALEGVLSERPPHSSRRVDPHAYASEAGQCSRKIALRIWHQLTRPAEAVRSDDEGVGLVGLLAFRIGEVCHTAVQDAMRRAYRDFRDEVPWDLQFTSGRADGVYRTQDGKLCVVEIKTKSPKKFEEFEASGQPDFDNVLQAILGALALDAQLVHIIYINKAAKAFHSPLLEWIYPLDGDLEELGFIEESRLQRVVEGAASGVVPAPVYHGEVLDPARSFWPCAFCLFRDECKLMGPEPVQLVLPIADEVPAERLVAAGLEAQDGLDV